MKRSVVLIVALLIVGCGLAACLPQEMTTAKADKTAAMQDAPDCLVCHGNKGFLLENRHLFLAAQKAESNEQSGEEGADEAVTAEQLAAGLYVDTRAMGAHGDIGCRDCHVPGASGDNVNAPDWHAAVVTDPTADGGQVCADCHGQEMIDNFRASLHFTLNGVAKGLCERLEQTPGKQQLFDEIFNDPEMYMGCNTCHATCGQCHVSNPNITGGGLVDSHGFGKPVPENTCNPCHYENAEYHLEVDVHATEHKMSCVDCHSDPVEFHGRPLSELSEAKLHYRGPESVATGPVEIDMKDGIVQVTCEQCHQDKVRNHPVEGVDHFAALECVACHSLPYSNCFGCHNGEKPEWVGAWGNGDPDTLNVKLGLSVPGDPASKLSTLNHAGMTEGAFGEGAPVIDTKNPETKAMWTPFTAHFIATRPLVSAAAKKSGNPCDNCHNGNLEIFLQEQDLDLGGNDPVSEIDWAVPADRLPKH